MSARPASRSRQQAQLVPFDDAQLPYLASLYAWRDGQAVNTIARHFWENPGARELMKIKRALAKARGDHFDLRPRYEEELSGQLRQLLGNHANLNLHVVDDCGFDPDSAERRDSNPLALYERIGRSAVYAEGARLIRQFVASSLAETTGSRQIVVANAGGHTLFRTVQAMLRHPVPDDVRLLEDDGASRLLFVAGNGAFMPREFETSANYIGATLANEFGGQHLALPLQMDNQFLQEYRAAIAETRLFICGVGTSITTSNGHSLVARLFEKENLQVPEDVVGDLAFNLLDRRGEPVSDLPPAAVELLNRVNPAIDLPTLKRIAREGRSLLLLDAKMPSEKLEVALAVLGYNPYVTDVVMGATMARLLVRSLRDSLANKRASTLFHATATNDPATLLESLRAGGVRTVVTSREGVIPSELAAALQSAGIETLLLPELDNPFLGSDEAASRFARLLERAGVELLDRLRRRAFPVCLLSPDDDDADANALVLIRRLQQEADFHVLPLQGRT